ncbi:MAG: SdpI family protein [Patescibacteria group bacterium]|nr:SdpI family protein [Patescibacteria group bacterium]
MKIKPGEIIAAVIIVVASYATWLVYPRLPDRLASHWGINGQVDGYLPKFWGAAIMPLIAVALLILLAVLPRIDPQKENIKKIRGYFDGFLVTIFLFLAYLQFLVIAWNLNYHLNIVRWMIPAMAVLFGVTGLLIGHVEPNWTIGIRTPWSLSSATVWRKTHALGGRLFYVAAVVMLGGMIYPALAIWFIIIPAVAAALVAMVYSYILYRGESKNPNHPAPTAR